MLEALKLVIAENEISPLQKKRQIKKFEKLNRRDPLTPEKVAKIVNSHQDPTEWAWRICAANLMLRNYDPKNGGWWGYECRSGWAWKLANQDWFYPRWDLKPCRLLVLAEQGLGDEIMFASCYQDVINICPDVTFEIDGRLIPAMERSFNAKFISRWNPDGEPYQLTDHRGDYDAYIPAGNLPKLFRHKPSDFNGAPFLKADQEKAEKWKSILPDDAVGILWVAGRSDEKFIDLHEMIEGFPINLHHKYKNHEMYYPNFSDTDDLISLVSALNHINCVPSAVAHIAGALGVSCNVIKTPLVHGEINTALKWYYPKQNKMDWYRSINLYQSIKEFKYYGLRRSHNGVRVCSGNKPAA